MATCKPKIEFDTPNFENDVGKAVLRFNKAVNALKCAQFQMQVTQKAVNDACAELNRYFPNGYAVSRQRMNQYSPPPEYPGTPSPIGTPIDLDVPPF